MLQKSNSRLLTLGLLSLSGFAGAQVTPPDYSQEAYQALARDSVWIYPGMEDRVDGAKIREAADRLKPLQLKVLVIPGLGAKWQKNGKELRGSYAENLLEKRLTLKNGLVVVITKKGMTAYSDTLGNSKLAALSNESLKFINGKDLTPAVVWLADNAGKKATTTGAARNTGYGLLFGIPIVLGGLYFAGRAAKKAADAARVRAQVLAERDKALEGISYLDGYNGLIAGQNGEALRQYRERASETYDRARTMLDTSKTPEQLAQVGSLFQQANSDIESGKLTINNVTGGSNTAFRIPPPIGGADPAAPLFEPVKGVDFFTSEPRNDLQPIEFTVNGRRQTVMVSPQTVASLQSGNPPQMAGQYQGDRFTPWYGVRGYDPYTQYGTGDFLWNMVAFSAISNMMSPWGWGYHSYGMGGFGHGGYGGGYGGGGSSDGNSRMSELDQSGDFGGGDFSDGGGDFGGGDFGGGDFGGGDF
ncbi:MAG: hypothetical protein K8R88_06730 [Armatimonadetes bacterium]|nr:hypothetical protein [Armatimonadota bacterium]